MSFRRKLTSNSGASMVLGLFFFFFCAAVGAIVLTAATANSGRVARLRQEDQNRLAAESAAKLVQESLSTLSFQGSYTKHNWMVLEARDGGFDKDGNSITYYVPVYYGPEYITPNAESKGDPVWVEQLKTRLDALYFSNTPLSTATGAVPFDPTPIQLTLSGEAMMGSQVSVTLTLKNDYTIEVSLSRADEPEQAEGGEGAPIAASAPPVGGGPQADQFMYFTLTPVRTDTETSRTTPRTHDEDTYVDYLTTVTWNAGAIMKGVKSSETPAP